MMSTCIFHMFALFRVREGLSSCLLIELTCWWFVIPDCLPNVVSMAGKEVWNPDFQPLHRKAKHLNGWSKNCLVPPSSIEKLANGSKEFVHPNAEKNTVWAVQEFSDWRGMRKRKRKRRKKEQKLLYWPMARQFTGKPRDRQAQLLAPLFQCPLSTSH